MVVIACPAKLNKRNNLVILKRNPQILKKNQEYLYSKFRQLNLKSFIDIKLLEHILDLLTYILNRTHGNSYLTYLRLCANLLEKTKYFILNGQEIQKNSITAQLDRL